MKKLKIILKSKYFLIIIIFLAILRVISIKEYKSILSINNKDFICTLLDINNNNVLLDCNEKVITSINDDTLKIGDILKINGTLKEIDSFNNFNIFNYKKYQNNRGIFYRLNINSYKKISKSSSILLNIKRIIIDRISNLKTYPYLKTFVLGDKSYINDNTLDNIKSIGIIHLLSISGMHISFLIEIINKIFKNSKRRDLLTITFLIFYYLIIESISLLRCVIFYLIKMINKNIGINKYLEIIISISIIIIIKPTAINEIGFYFSVILSSSISLLSKRLNRINNKILKCLYLSSLSFFISFPLVLYSYSEVNLLSIIYNIFFIPFVSFIIFPLSFITFLFPILDELLLFFVSIFEFFINICSSININFIFIKPSIFLIIIYYIIFILFFYNRKFLFLLLSILLIHYNYNILFKSTYILTIDVKQGDSILLHLDNYNVLIDTGGINDYALSNKVTIPLLKSYGIRKIDYLILSHGDFDHMGEAINLVNNFKVEKVIFNCGEFQTLEKELIKILDKKHIKYYSCIKEINIDRNKIYFLQTKEYDNENDNSNVIYTELNGYKFMFMGDASSVTEKEILNKYNLPDIDVLKVGHHGSRTSSSKEFINKIEPKYSIISVGKNNRYGHPNKEVLNILEESKIYRTDKQGSIMFKIISNKLKIETCSP